MARDQMRGQRQAQARAARERGIDDGIPSFIASLFARAAAAGHGDEEVAALIKVLRVK